MKIKTEAEYQELLAKISAKREHASKEPSANVPEAIATAKTRSLAKKKTPTTDTKPAIKRKGVKETPIMASLKQCSVEVECSATHATMLFKGARLFTLNEILAILQYRSYIVFSYKKHWQALVQQGMSLMGPGKPHFDAPCKITLFRQGKKAVDRDSLMVMFKYIIDALKDAAKTPNSGILTDDNPDIVYEDDKIQTIGEPLVGFRVQLIQPAPVKDARSVATLFNAPPKSIFELQKAAETAAGISKPVNPTKNRKPKRAVTAIGSKPKLNKMANPPLR